VALRNARLWEAQAQLDAEAATKANLAQMDSDDILASLLGGAEEPEEDETTDEE